MQGSSRNFPLYHVARRFTWNSVVCQHDGGLNRWDEKVSRLASLPEAQSFLCRMSVEITSAREGCSGSFKAASLSGIGVAGWEEYGTNINNNQRAMGRLVRDVRRQERADLRNRFLSIHMDAQVCSVFPAYVCVLDESTNKCTRSMAIAFVKSSIGLYTSSTFSTA